MSKAFGVQHISADQGTAVAHSQAQSASSPLLLLCDEDHQGEERVGLRLSGPWLSTTAVKHAAANCLHDMCDAVLEQLCADHDQDS
jgi:hypothetical protein